MSHVTRALTILAGFAGGYAGARGQWDVATLAGLAVLAGAILTVVIAEWERGA